MKQVAILVLSAFCLAPLASLAKDSQDYTKALKGVPAPELPAKSAEIVKKAKVRDWGDTTVGVVQAGVRISPVSAPAIVGAIAKSVPDMASLAASTAALEQPSQAAAIARAAASAAPARASKIVTAVSRAVPAQTRLVAVSVAESVPGAGRDVLTGVIGAQPELRRSLIASTASTAPEVAKALDQAYKDVAVAGPESRGPTISAPYVPASGTPANVDTTSSAPVPPGGRSYASP